MIEACFKADPGLRPKKNESYLPKGGGSTLALSVSLHNLSFSYSHPCREVFSDTVLPYSMHNREVALIKRLHLLQKGINTRHNINKLLNINM